MNNITLLGIELIICLIFILLSYKYLKILGLHIYTVVALILSNMMSLKVITIYNFDVNLGLIPFVTIFIATNIMLQKKGQEEVKKKTAQLTLRHFYGYFKADDIDFEDFDSYFSDYFTLWNNNEKDLEKNIKYIMTIINGLYTFPRLG